MYGTIAGVKAKAKQYQQIFDRGADYLNTEITDALNESTIFANQILVKRYDLAVIQANVPTIINEYAEIRAYLIILTQISQVDGSSFPADTIAQLEKRLRFFEEIFYNGDVLDDLSSIIEYTTISETIPLEAVTDEEDEETW